jgi:hypothetical protein
MSEPLWCEVRQHYCRCHDYGRRCEDFDDVREQLDKAAEKFMADMCGAALELSTKGE